MKIFCWETPQGTILDSILFVKIISDINEEVKESIVGCFAEDTKVSKMIGLENQGKCKKTWM